MSVKSVSLVSIYPGWHQPYWETSGSLQILQIWIYFHGLNTIERKSLFIFEDLLRANSKIFAAIMLAWGLKSNSKTWLLSLSLIHEVTQTCELFHEYQWEGFLCVFKNDYSGKKLANFVFVIIGFILKLTCEIIWLKLDSIIYSNWSRNILQCFSISISEKGFSVEKKGFYSGKQLFIVFCNIFINIGVMLINWNILFLIQPYINK